MIPVSTLDAAMLYAETPEMPMHTMGILILEPEGPLGADDLEASAFNLMRQRFAERLHLIPPFRRRIVQGPLQIGDPHWIEDPAFDLDKHLVRVSLPSPGGMRELCDFVGSFAGTCLERDRPLWKAVLVEGLEGGKLALAMKIHHAAMDGGRSAAIAGELMDTSPEGRVIPPPEEPWLPDREPTIPWLAADTLRTLAGKPRRAVEAASKMVEAARDKGHSQPAPSADSEVSEKPPLFEAPPTMFNAALTPNRSVSFADVSFDDVKAIKRAFGTTVNDVVLAGCCAALRTWLDAHGGLPDRPLIATVPVSVRHEGDQAGNRVSVIRVHLPIQSDDPVERLHAISAKTAAVREARRARGESLQHDLMQRWPLWTVISNWLPRIALATGDNATFSLIASNVPGPRQPLYADGAEVTDVISMGPLVRDLGLNFTGWSYCDDFTIGVVACHEHMPDLWDLMDATIAEFDVLVRRANAG